MFSYAIAHDLFSRNSATDIKPGDVIKSRRRENNACLDAKELPEPLRKVEVYSGVSTPRVAKKLLAITFVRTPKLIGAR